MPGTTVIPSSCVNISGEFNRGFGRELPLGSIFWARPQSDLGGSTMIPKSGVKITVAT